MPPKSLDTALEAVNNWFDNPSEDLEPVLEEIFLALVANHLLKGSQAERNVLLGMYEVLGPVAEAKKLGVPFPQCLSCGTTQTPS